jgi:hypothetical protein
MSLTVNIKPSPNGTILVVTDTNLLGKQFEDKTANGTPIHLDLANDFYSGKDSKVANVEEIQEKAKGAYILHLTGQQSIAALNHFFDKEDIIIIQDIPHIQIHLGE